MSTLGAVPSRAVVGPWFYVAHSVFFILGMPALANVLILRERGSLATRWCVSGVICTIFSLFLIVLQYVVAEALDGINGTDGPYSESPVSVRIVKTGRSVSISRPSSQRDNPAAPQIAMRGSSGTWNRAETIVIA